MNSTAFLLLANSNPEVDESKEMELTIGSLSFYIDLQVQLAFWIRQNWVHRQAKPRESQYLDHPWALPAR
jgi:hypothetical protein